ncbi:GFA family protein [Novosphingobium sp. PS1R-30]|uniref:GFA family protein n=1 Tax=Novosphingobium anseongense TaxID=3133436 RepID=A0ABU8RSU0_9SPHN|nr:MAG: GFA family protein [Novosphingobium sp.]
MSAPTEPLTGGCYCGAVRYEAAGEPRLRAQCHCRECQYLTGGGPNYFMMMPVEGFRYVRGEPASFTRSDIAKPVTRQFCGTCGTHLATRLPDFPALVLKVGGLDDPSAFGGPQAAIYLVDRQPFHLVPEGLKQFERTP